jgi:hypothetical protein
VPTVGADAVSCEYVSERHAVEYRGLTRFWDIDSIDCEFIAERNSQIVLRGRLESSRVKAAAAPARAIVAKPSYNMIATAQSNSRFHKFHDLKVRTQKDQSRDTKQVRLSENKNQLPNCQAKR